MNTKPLWRVTFPCSIKPCQARLKPTSWTGELTTQLFLPVSCSAKKTNPLGGVSHVLSETWSWQLASDRTLHACCMNSSIHLYWLRFTITSDPSKLKAPIFLVTGTISTGSSFMYSWLGGKCHGSPVRSTYLSREQEHVIGAHSYHQSRCHVSLSKSGE